MKRIVKLTSLMRWLVCNIRILEPFFDVPFCAGVKSFFIGPLGGTLPRPAPNVPS